MSFWLSKVQARVVLAVAALVLVGYPVVFWGWYLGAADRVTATVTGCQQGPHVCPGEGTWTMEDGSPGHGGIDGTLERNEIGTQVAVHATRSWALVDGPFNSSAAQFATWLPVVDGAALAIVLYARYRVRHPTS